MDKTMRFYEEKAIFEHNLRRKLEGYLHHCFVNFRDIDIFSPKSFSEFERICITEENDNSMVIDGIYHFTNDKYGRKYFVDRMSGLVFFQDGKHFHVAKDWCTSNQFDVFDAAYLRRNISQREKMNQALFILGDGIKETTSLDYLGDKISDIFSAPILEYTVSSRKEFEELIKELTSILSESKFFRKLWFRGQCNEYIVKRSQATIDKLGFPKEFECMPSLIPSAGRIINLEDYQNMEIMSMYWIQAFKVWLLSQAEGVVPSFKIDGPMYREMLKSLEPTKMVHFLEENPFDIEEYVYAQDLEPMWASILAAQQYGGATSMLDITDDIDVALFFTQSYLNKETRKYELCEPNSNNVIYLLASTRGSSTINLAKNIFASIPYGEKYSIPPRIFNQCCGLLRGADMFSRNTYAYRIIAKIKFSDDGIETTKTVDEMFPGIDVDTLYKTYFYAEPKLTGLYG